MTTRLKVIGILAAGLSIVLLLCGYLFFTGHFSTYKGTQYTVTLEQDGFHPKDLTIKKGDTIVFSSNTKNPFWPASNPHPIHSAYPVFDPKRPIQPGETWSFTFEKTGVWGFHDHLDSPTQGTITVTN